MEPCVSVVVPSHNRASILAETIPTYLQDGVAELILVDDASTDDTPEVVAGLMKEHSQIRYYRNEKNLRQTGTKNRALQYVTQPYVYFGDDDSILLPGSISFLLQAMKKYHADVMGALPLYADDDKDLRDVSALVERKAPIVDSWQSKIKLNHLETVDFFFRMKEPCQVPFTHACALVKKQWAKRAQFDPGYIGNSYREETDYWLQLGEQGAKIYFAASGNAAQINYPYSRIGRNRTFTSMWKHGKYDLLNTLRLIDKHHTYFRTKLGYPHSKAFMKISYVICDLSMYAALFPKRVLGMIVKKLKVARK